MSEELGRQSAAGGGRRRGRPPVNRSIDEPAEASAATSLQWTADALNRVRQSPDLTAAAATLRLLETDAARRVVGDALLSHLVPVHPDLEAWSRWATGGARPQKRQAWVTDDRVNGQSRAQRDMSRMAISAGRLDNEAQRLRSQAAELNARADAVADSAEACRDQARAGVVLLLDIALQNSIERAYSLGAGWVVLKSIAGTGRGRTLLADLDAWSDDASFIEELGRSIAGAVDRQQAMAGKAPHRHATGGDRTKTYLNSLPASVDEIEVRKVLLALIPEVERRVADEDVVDEAGVEYDDDEFLILSEPDQPDQSELGS